MNLALGTLIVVIILMLTVLVEMGHLVLVGVLIQVQMNAVQLFLILGKYGPLHLIQLVEVGLVVILHMVFLENTGQNLLM